MRKDGTGLAATVRTSLRCLYVALTTRLYEPRSCVRGNEPMGTIWHEPPWHECKVRSARSPVSSLHSYPVHTSVVDCTHSPQPHCSPSVPSNTPSDSYRFSTPSQATACRPIFGMSASHPVRPGSSQQPLIHRQSLTGSYRSSALSHRAISASTAAIRVQTDALLLAHTVADAICCG